MRVTIGASSRPANASAGNGHHHGARPYPSASGADFHTQCCSSCSRPTKPNAANETGTPTRAETSNSRPYPGLRSSARIPGAPDGPAACSAICAPLLTGHTSSDRPSPHRAGPSGRAERASGAPARARRTGRTVDGGGHRGARTQENAMPGSMTISHTDALVMLSHEDAKRLTAVLSGLSDLAATGQLPATALATLSGGDPPDRAELATWSRNLAAYLHDHL